LLSVSAIVVPSQYPVEQPLNREPPVQELAWASVGWINASISQSVLASFPSMNSRRNHRLVPYINADEHAVRVDGNVSQELKLSGNQLRSPVLYNAPAIGVIQCGIFRVSHLETCSILIPCSRSYEYLPKRVLVEEYPYSSGHTGNGVRIGGQWNKLGRSSRNEIGTERQRYKRTTCCILLPHSACLGRRELGMYFTFQHIFPFSLSGLSKHKSVSIWSLQHVH